MTAHCPPPPPVTEYPPSPLSCHQGHADVSSVSETAFTGAGLSGPSIALVLVLLTAALVFTLRKLVT